MEHKFGTKRECSSDASQEKLDVSGANFEFTFSNTVVDLINVMRRMSAGYYPTWQEASEAAKKLGANSQREFAKKRIQDPLMPRHPEWTYEDFPGWRIFMGTAERRSSTYLTLVEAREAAKRLGIKTYGEYHRRYKEDNQLPSHPELEYSSVWRGWSVFFGRTPSVRPRKPAVRRAVACYPTLIEASSAVKRLGIKKSAEYRLYYKKDPHLPHDPSRVYREEWRSGGWTWPKFLGTAK